MTMNAQSVPSNIQKQLNYREQFKRIDKALNNNFYLEALFIEYAIMEDRTESILRYEGNEVKVKDGGFVSNNRKLTFPAIEQDSLIYESFSFEDFCKYYKVDDTITEAVFQQKKESDDRIQVSLSKKASIGDLRETEVYYIDEEGIIRDTNHNVDNKMMDAVKKWEEKFN